MSDAPQRHPRVSGHALTVLAAAVVSLIVGFSFGASSPMGISEDETQRWFRAHDMTFQALRVVGLLLVILAVLLLSGRIGFLRWGGWGLILYAIAILAKGGLYAWESYAIGRLDIFAVVMLILAGVGFFEGRLLLREWRTLGGPPAPPA